MTRRQVRLIGRARERDHDAIGALLGLPLGIFLSALVLATGVGRAALGARA